MNAWDHLPNAAVIDEVLESLKKHPDAWGAARNAAWGAARNAAWGAARGEAWDAVRNAARDAARNAAWDAARGEARSVSWSVAWGATWGAARDAAWDAIAVLIAYDDMGELIKQPLPHLQGLYRLNPHPAFLLFQPASFVFNQLESKT